MKLVSKMLLSKVQSQETASLFHRRLRSLIIVLFFGTMPNLILFFSTSIASQHLNSFKNNTGKIDSTFEASDHHLSISSFITDSRTIGNFFTRTKGITKTNTNITPIVQTIGTSNACNVMNSNLDFENQNFQCWNSNTNLSSSSTVLNVVSAFGDGTSGFDTYSALLGDPSQSQMSALGPDGYVSLSHVYTVTIPNQGDPELHFDYLMYSYDIIYAAQNNYLLDWLEVGIISTGQAIPLEQYGNPNLDWDGFDSICRPTFWVSNSGQIKHEVLSLAQYRGQTISIYFTLYNKTDNNCNSWVFIDNIKVEPEILISKTSDPSGSVYEGDVITYTISYTNTGLVSQTLTITDALPFNVTLIPTSVSPPAEINGSTLVWSLGDQPPGATGKVSFQVQVPLLPSLSVSQSAGEKLSLTADEVAYILPYQVSCDTTRFWANGVTIQTAWPSPQIFQVQIPPGAGPSEMWLLMKGISDTPPTVAGQPAQLVKRSHNTFGASLWSAPITPTIANDQVEVFTGTPRELNALFLFDKNDPPFDPAALDDFFNTTKTFTYTLDIPSVATQTVDVILPFLDITYVKDDLEFDPRLTEITIQFNGQSQTVFTNSPNLGNGLLMTQFPFDIGPLADTITSTGILTVTVNTEDSLYTLGPRICRPVYIENTAWLCSDQAGCVSSIVRNTPEDMVFPYGFYLPVILKPS